MKVIVNLPELEEDKIEFESRTADFHATLLIEKIKQLHIDNTSKQKLLNLVLEHLKGKECMSD